MSQARPKIEVGYRVGMLTVVSATPQRKGSYTIWQCRCDCGGEILLDTRTLQRGSVRNCGCQKRVVAPGARDLTGQRFGKLVCIEPTEKRGPGGSVYWRCKCDCGNECLGTVFNLTQGKKTSCGCVGHPPLKDWIGKRVGFLTIIAYEEKRGDTHFWRCRCDCGNETVVAQSTLLHGHTQSCGCLKNSVYQENFQQIDSTNVSLLESQLQGGTYSTNKSGYNGVYFDRRKGKWVAEITFKRKKYYLGAYADIMDAVKARRKGEEMYEDFLDWYYTEYRKGKERATG